MSEVRRQIVEILSPTGAERRVILSSCGHVTYVWYPTLGAWVYCAKCSNGTYMKESSNG